jgi:predicted alpha/beta hydrolase family esterase
MSRVIASPDDPYCSIDRAAQMAAEWGSELTTLDDARGHINGASGLGDWPEGLRWLEQLAAGPKR